MDVEFLSTPEFDISENSPALFSKGEKKTIFNWVFLSKLQSSTFTKVPRLAFEQLKMSSILLVVAISMNKAFGSENNKVTSNCAQIAL